MTLTNPPPVVTAISDKLKACDEWDDSWEVYYPSTSPDVDLPLAVIEPTSTTHEQLAAGASGIRSGSARIIIILPGTYSIGEAETLAHTLCDEIAENPVGLWISMASFELSSEPDQGDQEGATITATIDITHGLGA